MKNNEVNSQLEPSCPSWGDCCVSCTCRLCKASWLGRCYTEPDVSTSVARLMNICQVAITNVKETVSCLCVTFQFCKHLSLILHLFRPRWTHVLCEDNSPITAQHSIRHFPYNKRVTTHLNVRFKTMPMTPQYLRSKRRYKAQNISQRLAAKNDFCRVRTGDLLRKP